MRLLLHRVRSLLGLGPLGAALAACLCATALLFLVGCERQIAPPLVDVTELAPREVETAEKLEVHGAGFPQGRTGRVVFDGIANRPGEPAVRVRADADGTVIAPDRLEIVVREDFAERFCGTGDRAAHATFHGSVEVSFASTTPGAPPLVGRVRAATLDVLPSSARASVGEARAAEGRRLLAFVGVAVGAPTARGLPIERVTPGSLAERAALRIGDVIVAVDGVHALNLSDVAPASARSTDLAIRRGDSGAEETRTFPIVDWSGDRIPSEYGPALVLVGLALAVLLLLLLPGPPSLLAVEMQIATHARGLTAGAAVEALFGTGRHATVTALVSASVSGFAMTPWVIGRETDGFVLVALATAILLWSKAAEGPGVLGRARVVLETSAAGLALGASVVLAVVQTGAIELADIVRRQGGMPWQFNAARYPGCSVLAVVFGASVVALLRVRPAVAARPSTALVERAGAIIAAALGTIVFLGGWQLPGSPLRGQAIVLLGGVVFVLKTWAVLALLAGVSRLTPRALPREVPWFVLRRLVPGLLLGGALVFASRHFVPSAAVETAFGATVVAMIALFTLRLVTRARAAASRPEPHASPFI